MGIWSGENQKGMVKRGRFPVSSGSDHLYDCGFI
ncbi:unnamed protein product, partial [marine sediment metagenome]